MKRALGLLGIGAQLLFSRSSLWYYRWLEEKWLRRAQIWPDCVAENDNILPEAIM